MSKLFFAAVIIACASVLVSAGTATAQQSRREKIFDLMDKDKDGAVSQDEYISARETHFGRLDKDGGGTLSREEYSHILRRTPLGDDTVGDKAEMKETPVADDPKAARRARFREKVDRRFETIDRDGSGDLSLTEFSIGGTDMFRRLDTDQNGSLTREELKRTKEERRQKRQKTENTAED